MTNSLNPRITLEDSSKIFVSVVSGWGVSKTKSIKPHIGPVVPKFSEESWSTNLQEEVYEKTAPREWTRGRVSLRQHFVTFLDKNRRSSGLKLRVE